MSNQVTREILFKNGDKFIGYLDEDEKFIGTGTYAFKQKKLIYQGEFYKGKFNGKGRLYSTEAANPYEIDGTFSEGLPDGVCRMIYPDGSEYNGPIEAGKRSGKGKLAFTSPSISISTEEGAVASPKLYEGDFKNDLMEGQGKLTFSDGSVYTGEFKNNAAEGRGKLISPGCSFSGFFLNNKKEGEGVAIYSNGEKYEGGFKEDMKHGKGKYYYSDQSLYDGYWINDIKEGKGDLKIKCENEKMEFYSGDFKAGAFDGKGIYDAQNSKGFTYTGDFKNNLAQGKGEISYGKGGNSVFKGNFMKNIKHGECQFISGPGQVYKGEFMLGTEKQHKADFGPRK
jgi:hypothetical protein